MHAIIELKDVKMEPSLTREGDLFLSIRGRQETDFLDNDEETPTQFDWVGHRVIAIYPSNGLVECQNGVRRNSRNLPNIGNQNIGGGVIFLVDKKFHSLLYNNAELLRLTKDKKVLKEAQES